MKEYSKDLPKWGLLYILIWFQFGYPCTSYSIWEKCSYRIRNIFKFEICLSCELFVKSSRSMDFSLKLECNFLSKHSYWVTALQANFCIIHHSRTEEKPFKFFYDSEIHSVMQIQIKGTAEWCFWKELHFHTLFCSFFWCAKWEDTPIKVCFQIKQTLFNHLFPKCVFLLN